MLASSLNRCLGSTQHLKNKYGGGYTLDLKCGSDLSTDWENLQSAVEEIFGKDKAAIYESFSDRRTYSVSQEGVKSLMKVFNSLEKCKSTKRKHHLKWLLLALMFRICQTLQNWRATALHSNFQNCNLLTFSVKSDYDVEEYSFGQTTLEQVFIKFAKEQDLEEE